MFVTSLAQVTALVDAHVKRDHDRFRAVALQIAAHVSSRSERGADQLRRLVDRQQAISLVPLPSANGLLSPLHDLATLDDMVLMPALRARLDRIVLEHSRRDDLLSRGLRPARKLLFVGAPGVGKGMATRALASALQLPLFRVELHGVISQYLGETAAKLAKVFEHVRAMPAVYLFDEFDAIGSERSALGSESAGSELRRVVNSLLQFIEDDQSDGLIVAATNHPQMLDGAIFRRFDETVAFEPLTQDELATLIARSIVDFEALPLDYGAIFAANPRLGHADLCAALDHVRKDHVLVGTLIDTAHIVEAITKRTLGVCTKVFA